MPTFTVIYRTGGTDRFRWHRTCPVATHDEAIARKCELERKGYKSRIFDTAAISDLNLARDIGLPEGWSD